MGDVNDASQVKLMIYGFSEKTNSNNYKDPRRKQWKFVEFWSKNPFNGGGSSGSDFLFWISSSPNFYSLYFFLMSDCCELHFVGQNILNSTCFAKIHLFIFLFEPFILFFNVNKLNSEIITGKIFPVPKLTQKEIESKLVVYTQWFGAVPIDYDIFKALLNSFIVASFYVLFFS